MKRILTLLMIFCLTAVFYTGTVLAEEPTSGTCGENITWSVADGTLTISGTGVMDNYTTGEPAPWKTHQHSIEALVVEPGVTVLGEYAFWELTGLGDVSLPDTLTHIGKGAFHSCWLLYHVELPESLVSIGDEAFQYCDNLQTIVFPDSVTHIGEYAFSGCTSMDHVIIPESITQINAGVFSWCSNLCHITLPSTLTTIGERAFSGCGMEQITVTDGVTYIGNSAFDTCEYLMDISLPESLLEVGEYAFSWCTSLESVTLPESLTKVGWGMFNHCVHLKEISIPDTVTEIGAFAFEECYELRNIDLPDSVVSIGHYAFSSSGLRSFAVPEKVQVIDQGTFWSCTQLKDLTIPDGITSVGKYAFQYCESLVTVHCTGSQFPLDSIVIDSFNEYLTEAVWHFDVKVEQEDRPAVYACAQCGSYQPGVEQRPVPVSLTVKPITVRPYIDSYGGGIEDSIEDQFYTWESMVDLELTLSNGEVLRNSEELVYYDGRYYNVQFTDPQNDGQVWLPGNTYTAQLTVMGFTADISITVDEFPIESIVFLPITRYNDLDLTTSGAWDENNGYVEYPSYYWEDSLTALVTFKDGTTGTFGYTIYYGDNEYHVSVTDSQSPENIWTAGNTYTETARVAGFTCPVTITIKETAVERVEADPLVLYDGGDGFWTNRRDPATGEWVDQYLYRWEDLATYTMYFTDGTVVNAQGTSFEFNGLTYHMGWSDSQDTAPYKVGCTYRERLVLEGRNIYFDVTVEPTPVVSVTAENVKVEDRIHGDWYKDYNSENKWVRYFKYDWQEKVKYTITFRDGTVLDCEGHEFSYHGRTYEIKTTTYQSAKNSWEAGQTYVVDLIAMSVSTELSVTVAENPVDRVEVQPIFMVENGTGMWETGYDDDWNYVDYFDYNWSDCLRYTVYFKDGTSLYSEDYFFPYDGRNLFFSQSDDCGVENPWTVGNTYHGTLYLFDLEIDVPVTIVPGVAGKSFTLSFEDEVLVNFYYQVGEGDDVQSTGMAVFYQAPDGEIDLENADEVYENPVYDPVKGRYMCQTTGIAAKDMGDSRYYVAFAKLTDETYVYSEAYEYSPKQYALNMLDKTSTSDKQKALCVALLNYGAAAQSYFNHNADDPMNAKLTAEHKALIMGYDRSLFKSAVAWDKETNFVKTEGFKKKTATVSFEGAFAINFYMTPKTTADTMTLYVWTPDSSKSATGLTAENAVVMPMVKGDDGRFFAQVAGIAPKNLDDTYYVAAVYTDASGNECCTGIIAYSLSKYCLNNDSGNMAELAKATAMYGYYAKEYFKK